MVSAQSEMNVEGFLTTINTVIEPPSEFEESRLAVLQSLDLLETLPERTFDGLVELAKGILDTPTALISLVGRDRQWFKARIGMDACETSRDTSFCTYTIRQAEPLIVPDATKDERFAANPFVTGEMGIRFYIGIPILVSGQAVGTFCCLDYRPREVSESQIVALKRLAEQAELHMEGRLRSVRAAEEIREAKRFAESMAEGSTSLLYLVDLDSGSILWENRSVGELLGYGQDVIEAIGPDLIASVTHPDDLERVAAHSRELLEALDDEVIEVEARCRNVDGEWRWLWYREKVYKRSEGGRPLQVLGTAHDITERKQMEAQLLHNEEQFRTVLESLHEGLIVNDEEGRIVYWNRSAERVLGMSDDGLRDHTDVAASWRTIHEDGTDFPYEEHPIRKALSTGRAQEPTVMGFLAPGEAPRWITINAAPVLPDGDLQPTGAVASFLDVTERLAQEHRINHQLQQISEYSAELENANRRLEALATTDGLTNLKNHRYFQDFLRNEIERCQRDGVALSIALIDVDHFKAYNDDFGHQQGDAVLRRVARTLQASTEEGDLAARYGGEEFVIVLPGLNESEAAQRVESIRMRLAAESFPHRAVTASFGVASLDGNLSDAASLIEAADEGLYFSKFGGRDRVTVWSSISERSHEYSGPERRAMAENLKL